MTPAARPWVFLTHTLERVGPPVFLLHLLRWLAEHDTPPLEVVALEGGPLRGELAEVACLHVVGDDALPDERLPQEALPDAARRHVERPGLVYVNTAISVRAATALPDLDAPWVVHIHELEVGLSLHGTAEDWQALDRPGTHWVAASRAVADNLSARHAVDPAAIAVHHEMIDTAPRPGAGPVDVRAQLGLAPGTPIAGTAAVVNWRKAPDLFLQLAWGLDRRATGAHVIWLGADDEEEASRRFRADVAAAGLDHAVHVLDAVDDPIRWMAAFDVFVLPAREDAFPLACLEAASVGCPVVCFDSGGIPEFVEDDAGVVVPYPDVDRLTDEVARLLRDPERRRGLGATAQAKVRERHDVRVAAPRLLADLRAWAR